MKILIAYDGSPAAEAAVEAVAKRPWPDGSEVRLITIVDRPFPPTSGVEIYAPVFEQLRSSYREEAYDRLQLCLEMFRARPDLVTSYELRDGNAKQALLEAIRDWQADLVVAGSHGAKGLTRLFLGSVCHALVTHAPCNVEVVKAPAEQGLEQDAKITTETGA